MRETERSRIKRHPERGSRYRDAIYRVLDEGLVCHVGFAVEGQPYVIPMSYGRRGDALVLHGSVKSRLMRELGKGLPACVTVTLLDGLVLARSVFHHSMNYRSVVALGTLRRIKEEEDVKAALTALVEHLVPGRSSDARAPSTNELMITAVLEMDLDEVTLKTRSGPPIDPPRDLELPVWAGEIPLRIVSGEPIPAPDLGSEVDVPEYARAYRGVAADRESG